MADEVIARKEALQVDFKTALASTLMTMGLEQLKPKQVREKPAFYKSLVSTFIICRKKLFKLLHPEKMYSLFFRQDTENL